MTDINEKIKQKKEEIENYQGVLDRYGSGRWMDQGRRRLAELKEQLVALQASASSPVIQPDPVSVNPLTAQAKIIAEDNTSKNGGQSSSEKSSAEKPTVKPK